MPLTLPASRRRSLLVGTVAAVVAITAGTVTYAVLADDADDASEPEVELSLDASDAESSVDDLTGSALEGDAAPSVSFALLDGGSMSLADLRGTPVVVSFFASWCAPCVTEMPAFESVYQELGDEVAFVGIAVQDAPEKTQELLDETGVTYTIGRDAAGTVFESFEGVNMPSTFVLDADGIIVGVSADPLDADGLRELIASAQ